MGWCRRGFCIGLALGLGLGAGADAQSGGVLVVSRKRLLHEAENARLLRDAEIELAAELQRRVDLVKVELNAEEQELARVRRTLDREEFDRRVADFDTRVRDERRRAQLHASNLQNALSAERLKLVEAIDPVLESMRAERGALAILNADQVLAVDPAIDITDDVIARFNAEVPPPDIPDLDALAPPVVVPEVRIEGAPSPEPAEQ